MTAPSGKVYRLTWTRKGDPTQADLDAALAKVKEMEGAIPSPAPSKGPVRGLIASALSGAGLPVGEPDYGIPPELEALPNPMGGPPILKGIPGKGKTGMTALEAGTKLNQKQEELAQRLSFLDYFSPFKGTPAAGLTSPSHLAAGAVMAPVQTAASGMILTAPESSWQDRVGAATEILTNFVGPAEVLSGFKILGKPAFNTLLKAVHGRDAAALRQVLIDAERSGINVGKLMQGMEHPGVSVGAKAGIPKMAQVPEGIAGKAKGRAPKTAVPEPPVKPAEVGGGKAKEPWEMTEKEFEATRTPSARSPQYAGEHGAPLSDSGSPLWDVTRKGSYPKDVYGPNGRHYYGTGDDALDSEAYGIIQQHRNNSTGALKIYRAVPKDLKGTGETLINPGDWVTISRRYAKDHGEGALGGNYRIVSKDVRARDIFTNGDSWLEWGYDPQPPTHRSYVARAAKLGKPVPPEVLADYPDLAAKYPPKGAPTAKPTPEAPKRGLEEVGGIRGTPNAAAHETTWFHGTSKKFEGELSDQSLYNDLGIFLTSDKDLASEYTRATPFNKAEPKSGTLVEATVTPTKVYDIRFGRQNPDEVAAVLDAMIDRADKLADSPNRSVKALFAFDGLKKAKERLLAATTKEEWKRAEANLYEFTHKLGEAEGRGTLSLIPLREELRKLGYDAVRKVDDGSDTIVALDPSIVRRKVAPTAKPTPEAPKRGLEEVGGAGSPRLSTLAGEIPKPFKAEPKPVASPRRVSEVEPKATGLANQVQARKTIEGVLEDIEPTKGKGPEHWQSEGKKAVDEGEYDPNILADRIARGKEELTGKKVGVLLEGARIHENKVNQAAKAVDDAIAKGGDVQGARKAYQEAQEAYQNFAEQVQQGKGRWSDVGRALQAGTELDTGNYAQVIQAAKRSGNVGPKLEAQLQKQSETIADLNEKLAAKDAEIAKARAEGGVTRAASRKATRQAIQQEREAIFKEIDDLFKEAASAGLHAPASAAYTAVKAGSKLAAAGGKLALNYAKEGITLIDEIAERVIRDFKAKGLEIDRQTIIDEMAKPQHQTKTKNEIQKALASLRAQVKRESTASKAKIQGEIESLQRQLETGDFRTPSKRELILSKELEDLRAERDLHAARVRSAIHSLGQSTAKKITQEVAGAVRGTILGTDFGILTRQGLFGLSRPVEFAKSTGKAIQAMLSEKNLVRIENNILSHDVAGQTAGVAYRKYGLGLSSHLTHPEELVVGKLIRRIPGIGRLAGTLERGQSAFINTLRSEMFDRAIRLGYKDNELLARANFINSATGRSNAKNIPTFLEAIMTSPRYERSRWEMLAQPLRNPGVILKDLATKKGLNRGAVANLQDMAVTAAEIYGLYKVAEANGYSTNFDPTSSDFLKMRKGDEVWDPSAGIAPRLRDMMRFVAWSMEPSYHDNVLKVIGQSAVRPLSPAIRQPLEVGSQQVQRALGVPEEKLASVFTGWKLDEDEKGWITFAPLIVQTVKKYLDKGDSQGAMDAAWKEFIGQSVNRYAPPKK